MSNTVRYVLLNAGTKTRKAFERGIAEYPLKKYQTRTLLLHITASGTPRFIHRSKPIVWDDASVFLRLRGDDAEFCGMLYDYFHHHAIPANDPVNQSYDGSAEKISQMLSLALGGVQVPETIIFREEGFFRHRDYIQEHMPFPLIYKTNGRRGEQVSYIPDWDTLEAHVRQKQPAQRALIQPFIENTFDTRTIVVFGKILGTIARTRTQGHLNNIAQGATATRYELTPSDAATAIRAAECARIDVAGVDMIHTPTGPIVLEVNKSPHVSGFESVHGISVFENVAELMRARIK